MPGQQTTRCCRWSGVSRAPGPAVPVTSRGSGRPPPCCCSAVPDASGPAPI